MLTFRDVMKRVLQLWLTEKSTPPDSLVFVMVPELGGRHSITDITVEDNEILIHIEE